MPAKTKRPPKNPKRSKNRNKETVCEDCGKKIRLNRMKEHKCKGQPFKTPSGIAKCPNCDYTDIQGNLQAHLKKKSGKCRVAGPQHLRAAEPTENARVKPDYADSESEELVDGCETEDY